MPPVLVLARILCFGPKGKLFHLWLPCHHLSDQPPQWYRRKHTYTLLLVHLLCLSCQSIKLSPCLRSCLPKQQNNIGSGCKPTQRNSSLSGNRKSRFDVARMGRMPPPTRNSKQAGTMRQNLANPSQGQGNANLDVAGVQAEDVASSSGSRGRCNLPLVV